MSSDLVGVQRILLIGGDEDARRVVSRALSHSGAALEVTEAVDAASGLKLLETGAFDCLLLDLPAPGRDDAWLLSQMRERALFAPVIILAHQLDAPTAVELMKAGAIDYIPRGLLEPDRLWQRVRQAIRIGRAEGEARSARQAQRQTEDLLRLIVDSVPALVSYVDSSFRYRWLNRQYSQWFGMALEADGQLVEEVLGAEAFQAVKPFMERALTGETVSYQMQLPYRTGPRWVEATYVPHRAPEGKTLGLVVLVQDITDRRAEEERRRRQLGFEQQLLGIVSHDLRDPISVISINAAMLLRREDTPAAATKSLARILASADRASRMVRDLLDFTQARLGGGIPIERRQVDFFEVIRQVLDEVQSSFPEREVTFEHQGNGQGMWDPHRLGQIIANLLTNALTYSAAGTPVRVVGRALEDAVFFEVHNAGDPIPSSVLPSLFEPFKRGRDGQSTRSSIGLGLYIVKHLVEAHGGQVQVDSRAEQGTTFRVSLPRGMSVAPEDGVPSP